MWPTLVLFLIELLFIFSDAGTHPSQFAFAGLQSRPLWQNVQITFNISDQRKDLVLKGLPRRSSPTGSSPLSRLGTTGGEASMSKPDLRFVKFSSLCCFWFSWRENDFDTCVGNRIASLVVQTNRQIHCLSVRIFRKSKSLIYFCPYLQTFTAVGGI